MNNNRTNPILLIMMAVFAFLCIYPFYYILILSLNDAIDLSRGGIYLWPRMFTLDNYKIIFQNPYLLDSFKVSVGRVLLMTLLVPFLNALYGYALIKRDLVARKFFAIFMLIPMYVGGGIIPFYFVLTSLKIYDTFFVYIFPALYVPFNIMLFRSYFQEQSPSMRESAIIDGASEFNVFIKIIIPLSMPIIAAISLFTAVGTWNEWFNGQLFVRKPSLWPLSTLLIRILSNQSLQFLNMVTRDITSAHQTRVTPEAVRLAMITVVTVPILVVYPFLQKYFISGIMIGAVKE